MNGNATEQKPKSPAPGGHPDLRQQVVAPVIIALLGALGSLLPPLIVHAPLITGWITVVVLCAVAGVVIVDALREGRVRLGRRGLAILIGFCGAAFAAAIVTALLYSPPPPPRVSITSPQSVIHCPPHGAPYCKFVTSGTMAGQLGPYKILVLLYPVNPNGGGWIVQWPPASTGAGEAWYQSPDYIGSSGTPASNGDTFWLEAVVVSADASYGGSPLQPAMRIVDLRQISGLASQSRIVSITVRRP